MLPNHPPPPPGDSSRFQKMVYQGRDRKKFERDCKALCTQLLSVATDHEVIVGEVKDSRTCLSAYICPPTKNGFLIAVRESVDTPPHILQLAQELHDQIQAHYQLAAEGKPFIGSDDADEMLKALLAENDPDALIAYED